MTCDKYKNRGKLQEISNKDSDDESDDAILIYSSEDEVSSKSNGNQLGKIHLVKRASQKLHSKLSLKKNTNDVYGKDDTKSDLNNEECSLKDEEVLDKLTAKMHKLTKSLKKSKSKIASACSVGESKVVKKLHSKNIYNMDLDIVNNSSKPSLISHQALSLSNEDFCPVSATKLSNEEQPKDNSSSNSPVDEKCSSPNISQFFKKVSKEEHTSQRNKNKMTVPVEVHASQDSVAYSPPKSETICNKIINPSEIVHMTYAGLDSIEFHGHVPLNDSVNSSEKEKGEDCSSHLDHKQNSELRLVQCSYLVESQ